MVSKKGGGLSVNHANCENLQEIIGRTDWFSYLASMRISGLVILICLLLSLSVVGSSGKDDNRRTALQNFDLVGFDPSQTEAVEQALESARSKLIEWLHDSLSYRPTVALANTQEEFDSLIKGYFPDWGAAAAMPERKMIVIKSPLVFNLNRSLKELLTHEYTHLALAHRAAGQRLPRWFNEGMAMRVSMEWSWSDNLAMSKAAVFRQLIGLNEIELVNRFTESKAHVAYAESYLSVNYLFDAYGLNAVNILLDSLARSVVLDQAMMAATGSDVSGFQEEVWATFKTRFNVLSLFMDTIYFWTALAIILVIGAVLSYRKRGRQYRRWEEEEQLHSTDFDYGDPDHPEQIDDEDEPWRS